MKSKHFVPVEVSDFTSRRYPNIPYYTSLMRIRHYALNAIPNSGGSSRYAFELSSQERKRGLDSAVIGFIQSQCTASRLADSWNLRKSGIDVVNIHYSGSFGVLGLALLPIKFSRIKIVSTFHGPWHLEAKSAGKSKIRVLFAYLTQKSIFSMSDSIIAMSSSFALLASRFTKKKILIEPPGINQIENHKLHSNVKLISKEVKICVVRRLVPRMGIDLAITSLTFLPDNYILKVIGEGPEKPKLILLTEELGLQLRVKFLGHISDLELEEILLESDLMVVPTRDLEGYGIVVLEAYARCLPVIATPVQGLFESIPKEFHKWALCESISAEAIADRIRALKPAQIPTHLEFQSVLLKNSWDIIVPKILREYDNS
jgi:glycosyltransferase involved in cell wall biosynthesis